MARDLQFGIFLSPAAAAYDETVRVAKLADDLELDLIGIQDHPYQRRFLDTFSLMASLLAQTHHVRVFPDVANLPLRGAAMIAKAAASLDVMSGGRFELGLGAGGFGNAVAAMGGPRRTPAEAVTAFVDAVAVIRALWSGERGLRVAGEQYHLAGVHSGPVPAHDIQIWSGAGGPRMLALTGELADGWIPSLFSVPPEKLDARHVRIDEAAEKVGRDPSAIRRLYNLNGRITDGASEGHLHGPTDQWVDQLGALANDHRIDSFIWGPDAGDVEGQVRRYAEQVAPAVRANHTGM